MSATLRWLAFACLVVLALHGQFNKTFEAAERYGYHPDIMPSDWIPTNAWLTSADCALSSGAWLAVCENDKLLPFSERSFGDDPGHAFLLGLWARAKGNHATLVDVARLNILFNTIGLAVLTGLLFALRAYLTSIVLMALGPAEYLGWMGISPHWSFVGVVSLAAVLPIVLLGSDRGVLVGRSRVAWLVAGFIFLAIATVVREVIGIMSIVVSLGAIIWLIRKSSRWDSKNAKLLISGAIALIAFNAPQLIILARNASFDMEPAQRRQTHGLSHTLYIGLGFVENNFGISYDDDYAKDLAHQLDPAVIYCSPEYYDLMWALYFDRLLEDPIEVMRIYIAKGWQLLASPTIYPGPPFGVILAVAFIHFLLSALFNWWQRFNFVPGSLIQAVSLAFLGLFLVQSILALPSQTYAMPANAFVLVLAGVLLEFVCRAVGTVASPALRRGLLRSQTLRHSRVMKVLLHGGHGRAQGR